MGSRAQIYSEIQPILEENQLDFVILDCEILPWSLKGRKLIKENFENLQNVRYCIVL